MEFELEIMDMLLFWILGWEFSVVVSQLTCFLLYLNLMLPKKRDFGLSMILFSL